MTNPFKSKSSRTWFELAGLIVGFLVLLLIAYVGVVALFGFENSTALVIHFGRVAFGTAAIILFVPWLVVVFTEIPPPGRDYLRISIILSAVSSVGFAFWNEAGRQFGVDTLEDACYSTNDQGMLGWSAGWSYHGGRLIIRPQKSRKPE